LNGSHLLFGEQFGVHAVDVQIASHGVPDRTDITSQQQRLQS